MGIIKLLLIIAFIVCFIFFPCFRCIVFNPHFTVYYGGVDIYHYFRYKLYNSFKRDEGQLDAYCGLFGKGKTLSCVHRVVSLYNRYNNKVVYDIHRKKWVTQKVVVLSNVQLTSIPFVECKSLKQITQFTKDLNKSDLENDTLSFLVVLLDELSVHVYLGT